MKKQAKQPGRSYVVRGIFALLTLAFALWVAPFAAAQRIHHQVSKSTLTSPSSLLERPRKEQQVQMTADSVKNRLQSPKQAARLSAPPIQEVPSRMAGIDCDNAPGIVIHDDGTFETRYLSPPGVLGIFVDKFTPASYPDTYTSVCL